MSERISGDFPINNGKEISPNGADTQGVTTPGSNETPVNSMFSQISTMRAKEESSVVGPIEVPEIGGGKDSECISKINSLYGLLSQLLQEKASLQMELGQASQTEQYYTNLALQEKAQAEQRWAMQPKTVIFSNPWSHGVEAEKKREEERAKAYELPESYLEGYRKFMRLADKAGRTQEKIQKRIEELDKKIQKVNDQIAKLLSGESKDKKGDNKKITPFLK